MPREFIARDEPVEVASLGHTDGEIVERMFYILFAPRLNMFLGQAYRPLWRGSWKRQLTKACLWNTPETAREFAAKTFSNISTENTYGKETEL